MRRSVCKAVAATRVRLPLDTAPHPAWAFGQLAFSREEFLFRAAPLCQSDRRHTQQTTHSTHTMQHTTHNIQHTRHDTTRAKHDTTSASPHLLMGAFVCCGAGMRLKMDEPATLCVGYPLRVYSMLWVSVGRRRTADWTISVCLKVKVVAGSTRSWPSKE